MSTPRCRTSADHHFCDSWLASRMPSSLSLGLFMLRIYLPIQRLIVRPHLQPLPPHWSIREVQLHLPYMLPPRCLYVCSAARGPIRNSHFMPDVFQTTICMTYMTSNPVLSSTSIVSSRHFEPQGYVPGVIKITLASYTGSELDEAHHPSSDPHIL